MSSKDDRQSRERLVKFAQSLGHESGVFWFSTGVDIAKAWALSKSEFGRRIEKHDAADALTGGQLAGLAHEADVSQWVALGAIPPADGKNKLGWPTWSVESLCQWAAGGCPDKRGRPSEKMQAMFGTDRPREY